MKHENLETDISFDANLSKGALYNLNVILQDPRATSTLQVVIGNHGLILPLIDKADGTDEGQHLFLATHGGFTNVTISSIQPTASDNTSAIVKLSQCILENSTSTQLAIDVKQIGPYDLTIFPRVIDSESEIRSLQLGIGTTKTGFQIRPLSSIPIGDLIKINFDAMHGSVLYTTVIAYNNAGLRAVFHGPETTVDHTPPEITNVTAELILTDKENATDIMSAMISVYFACDDEQSGVQYCYCRLGKSYNACNVHSSRSCAASIINIIVPMP